VRRDADSWLALPLGYHDTTQIAALDIELGKTVSGRGRVVYVDLDLKLPTAFVEQSKLVVRVGFIAAAEVNQVLEAHDAHTHPVLVIDEDGPVGMTIEEMMAQDRRFIAIEHVQDMQLPFLRHVAEMWIKLVTCANDVALLTLARECITHSRLCQTS
jgi:hypothetical protein